ncbi:MAG: hypothetical protein K8T89_14305, partial [Planctomycetes bacterium]|nr:hypothetical protein [Planctomycetota bacterium]
MHANASRIVAAFLLFTVVNAVRADPPLAMYLFPAGGQRGKSVDVLVGGCNLNKSCGFEVLGPGITGPVVVKSVASPDFEGPLLPIPESQRAEDYPKTMAAALKIASDAPTGNRFVRLWTSQGVTLPMTFVVGDLPEITETEIDGSPIPVLVEPPVTVNGRIYPRSNVDIWTVRLKQGQSLTCALAAASIGSPLEGRLVVRDPQGRKIVESRDGLRTDPKVRFVAAAAGDYQISLGDMRNDGGPAYVYRLTLATGPVVDRVFPLGGKRGEKTLVRLFGQDVPVEPIGITIPKTSPASFSSRWKNSAEFRLDADDLPEFIEKPGVENELPAIPAVANGIISAANEIDTWNFQATKGETFEINLRAERLGSPLLGVLTVRDAAGKTLTQAEGATTIDPTLRFIAPETGKFSVAVQDRFQARGGPDFAYRLRIDRPANDFELQINVPSLTIVRGQQAPLKITAIRHGNLTLPIKIQLDGLPEGISQPKEAIIAPNQTSVDIPLKADATAKIQSFSLRVRGTGYVSFPSIGTVPQPVTRAARFRVQDDELDSVRVAIAIPTPFKFVGEYLSNQVPRGTIYSRRYKVERNGFDGPIEVRMADRQARHLQGVIAGTITIPADKNEFEYFIQLPSWMETGRPCRVCVMGTATVK